MFSGRGQLRFVASFPVVVLSQAAPRVAPIAGRTTFRDADLITRNSPPNDVTDRSMAAVDHSTRIAEIESILRTGARRVIVDGVTVEHDLSALRRELRKLQLSDDAERSKRPIASRINLQF